MNAIPPGKLTTGQADAPEAAANPDLSIKLDNNPPGADAAGDAQQTAGKASPEPKIPLRFAQLDVTVAVQLGTHRIPLRDLMNVEPGQLFPLDKMTAEPVDILVNGHPFARGEVVAIGDRFGVRLTELLEPDSDS